MQLQPLERSTFSLLTNTSKEINKTKEKPMRYAIRRAAFYAQLRHRIRIVMAVCGLNNKQLAKDAKLTYSIVNNVLNCTKVEPKYGHLIRVADALDFDLNALVGNQSLFARKVALAVRQMA